MKLAKLSLAAIMTVGALSTVANAGSLENAIKGVTISGQMRYRFTDYDNKTKPDAYESHGYRSNMIVKVPVAKDFTMGSEFYYEGSGNASEGNKLYFPNGDKALEVQQFWFMKKAADYSVRAGMINMDTMFTDYGTNGHRGNGVELIYTGVKDWKLGAQYYMNSNLGKYVSSNGVNVYALNSKGKIGSVQVITEAIMIEKEMTSVMTDIRTEVSDFKIYAQAAFATFEDDSMDEGMFAALRVKYTGSDTIAARVGIYGTGKEGTTNLTADSSFHTAGTDIGWNNNNEDEMIAAYVDGSYSFGKASVSAGIAHVETAYNNWAANELTVGAKYKFNSKVYVKTYWENTSGDSERDKYRVEAKYSF